MDAPLPEVPDESVVISDGIVVVVVVVVVSMTAPVFTKKMHQSFPTRLDIHCNTVFDNDHINSGFQTSP